MLTCRELTCICNFYKPDLVGDSSLWGKLISADLQGCRVAPGESLREGPSTLRCPCSPTCVLCAFLAPGCVLSSGGVRALSPACCGLGQIAHLPEYPGPFWSLRVQSLRGGRVCPALGGVGGASVAVSPCSAPLEASARLLSRGPRHSGKVGEAVAQTGQISAGVGCCFRKTEEGLSS